MSARCLLAVTAAGAVEDGLPWEVGSSYPDTPDGVVMADEDEAAGDEDEDEDDDDLDDDEDDEFDDDDLDDEFDDEFDDDDDEDDDEDEEEDEGDEEPA